MLDVDEAVLVVDGGVDLKVYRPSSDGDTNV